jgi:hypothetical protein
VLLEDLERGTGRGTGRLIIPARRVLSVRLPVLSVQPVRPQRGPVSLVMRWPGGHHRQAVQACGRGCRPRVPCRFWSAVASKGSKREPYRRRWR